MTNSVSSSVRFRSLATSLITLSVLLGVAHAGGFKKYDIKSGIVKSEVLMSMSGMNIKSRTVIYFDDYGLTECQETYKGEPAAGETPNDVMFVKNGFNYAYSNEQKSGAKRKAMGYGVAARFDANEMTPKMKEEYKLKLLDAEMVCGKKCDGYSASMPSGDVRAFGWNHIMLKYELDNAKYGMKSVTTTTSIEENATIPAEKFTVPKDVVMKDM